MAGAVWILLCPAMPKFDAVLVDMSNDVETGVWPTSGRHLAPYGAFENRPRPGRCGIGDEFCPGRSR